MKKDIIKLDININDNKKIKDNIKKIIDNYYLLQKKYPNSEIVLQIQNTKDITSDVIKQFQEDIKIRIVGGYGEERVQRNKKNIYNDGETGDYYTTAVIYTRNEVYHILKKIEELEKGINKEWTDFQKFLYIYDKLKKLIRYDPKFEKKYSKDIRSLRGLITQETVCAGYALILKEILDRNGINCEYVEGYTNTGGHAWNIVNIDGKKYPVDLTWDYGNYKVGTNNTFEWLGKDVSEFAKYHIPDKEEKTQDYTHTLSKINPKVIEYIYSYSRMHKIDYLNNLSYKIHNSLDNSKFIITRIDANNNFSTYLYQEISDDNKPQSPVVICSTYPITYLLYEKERPNSKISINEINILLSKQNIRNSIRNNTTNIGSIIGKDNKFIKSISDIDKSTKTTPISSIKNFKRSNNTEFVIIENGTPVNLYGKNVHSYSLYELVKNEDNSTYIYKKNNIYTDINLINDNRKDFIANIFLNRKRIDKLSNLYGGYVGSIDNNNNIEYSNELTYHFSKTEKLNTQNVKANR